MKWGRRRIRERIVIESILAVGCSGYGGVSGDFRGVWPYLV